MSIVSFYLVRHAPVIGQDGIAYGRNAEIDDTCHQAFEDTAKQLPPDCPLWFTSEFPRTQKTALRLQSLLQNTAVSKINALFNEQNFGLLVGKERTAILADVRNADFLNDMLWQRPRGGESFMEMTERVRRGLNILTTSLQRDGIDSAVVVCHGGVIRAARHLSDPDHYPLQSLLKVKVPHLSIHPVRINGPL